MHLGYPVWVVFQAVVNKVVLVMGPYAAHGTAVVLLLMSLHFERNHLRLHLCPPFEGTSSNSSSLDADRTSNSDTTSYKQLLDQTRDADEVIAHHLNSTWTDTTRSRSCCSSLVTHQLSYHHLLHHC